MCKTKSRTQVTKFTERAETYNEGKNIQFSKKKKKPFEGNKNLRKKSSPKINCKNMTYYNPSIIDRKTSLKYLENFESQHFLNTYTSREFDMINSNIKVKNIDSENDWLTINSEQSSSDNYLKLNRNIDTSTTCYLGLLAIFENKLSGTWLRDNLSVKLEPKKSSKRSRIVVIDDENGISMKCLSLTDCCLGDKVQFVTSPCRVYQIYNSSNILVEHVRDLDTTIVYPNRNINHEQYCKQISSSNDFNSDLYKIIDRSQYRLKYHNGYVRLPTIEKSISGHFVVRELEDLELITWECISKSKISQPSIKGCAICNTWWVPSLIKSNKYISVIPYCKKKKFKDLNYYQASLLSNLPDGIADLSDTAWKAGYLLESIKLLYHRVILKSSSAIHQKKLARRLVLYLPASCILDNLLQYSTDSQHGHLTNAIEAARFAKAFGCTFLSDSLLKDSKLPIHLALQDIILATSVLYTDGPMVVDRNQTVSAANFAEKYLYSITQLMSQAPTMLPWFSPASLIPLNIANWITFRIIKLLTRTSSTKVLEMIEPLLNTMLGDITFPTQIHYDANKKNIIFNSEVNYLPKISSLKKLFKSEESIIPPKNISDSRSMKDVNDPYLFDKNMSYLYKTQDIKCISNKTTLLLDNSKVMSNMNLNLRHDLVNSHSNINPNQDTYNASARNYSSKNYNKSRKSDLEELNNKEFKKTTKFELNKKKILKYALNDYQNTKINNSSIFFNSNSKKIRNELSYIKAIVCSENILYKNLIQYSFKNKKKLDNHESLSQNIDIEDIYSSYAVKNSINNKNKTFRELYDNKLHYTEETKNTKDSDFHENAGKFTKDIKLNITNSTKLDSSNFDPYLKIKHNLSLPKQKKCSVKQIYSESREPTNIDKLLKICTEPLKRINVNSLLTEDKTQLNKNIINSGKMYNSRYFLSTSLDSIRNIAQTKRPQTCRFLLETKQVNICSYKKTSKRCFQSSKDSRLIKSKIKTNCLVNLISLSKIRNKFPISGSMQINSIKLNSKRRRIRSFESRTSEISTNITTKSEYLIPLKKHKGLYKKKSSLNRFLSNKIWQYDSISNLSFKSEALKKESLIQESEIQKIKIPNENNLNDIKKNDESFLTIFTTSKDIYCKNLNKKDTKQSNVDNNFSKDNTNKYKQIDRKVIKRNSLPFFFRDSIQNSNDNKYALLNSKRNSEKSSNGSCLNQKISSKNLYLSKKFNKKTKNKEKQGNTVFSEAHITSKRLQTKQDFFSQPQLSFSTKVIPNTDISSYCCKMNNKIVERSSKSKYKGTVQCNLFDITEDNKSHYVSYTEKRLALLMSIKENETSYVKKTVNKVTKYGQHNLVVKENKLILRQNNHLPTAESTLLSIGERLPLAVRQDAKEILNKEMEYNSKVLLEYSNIKKKYKDSDVLSQQESWINQSCDLYKFEGPKIDYLKNQEYNKNDWSMSLPNYLEMSNLTYNYVGNSYNGEPIYEDSLCLNTGSESLDNYVENIYNTDLIDENYNSETYMDFSMIKDVYYEANENNGQNFTSDIYNSSNINYISNNGLSYEYQNYQNPSQEWNYYVNDYAVPENSNILQDSQYYLFQENNEYLSNSYYNSYE